MAGLTIFDPKPSIFYCVCKHSDMSL